MKNAREIRCLVFGSATNHGEVNKLTPLRLPEKSVLAIGAEALNGHRLQLFIPARKCPPCAGELLPMHYAFVGRHLRQDGADYAARTGRWVDIALGTGHQWRRRIISQQMYRRVREEGTGGLLLILLRRAVGLDVRGFLARCGACARLRSVVIKQDGPCKSQMLSPHSLRDELAVWRVVYGNRRWSCTSRTTRKTTRAAGGRSQGVWQEIGAGWRAAGGLSSRTSGAGSLGRLLSAPAYAKRAGHAPQDFRIAAGNFIVTAPLYALKTTNPKILITQKVILYSKWEYKLTFLPLGSSIMGNQF